MKNSMKNSIATVNQGVNGIMTPEIPLIPDSVTGVARALVSLNDRNGEGKWEFWKTPVEGIPVLEEADRDFDFTVLDQEGWTAVIVPGELEMQGFELQNNTEYYYRTTVHVPDDFAGCKCLLRFDGVYSNARVWVDNRYVRSHQGGFTTWYCDITEHAVPGGEVQLVVGIADLEGDQPGLYNDYQRRPLRDPSFASNYAHHNIGGILRDVSLMALPGTYLARLHTEVAFDDGFRDAGLQIGVQVNSAEHDVTATYALYDADGGVCLEEVVLLSGDDCRKADVRTLQVKEPRHWDAEHPYLYTLRIALAVKGQVQAVYREKIGFREIWFSGKKGSDRNKVYVNGKQVKLRGTCRHDVDFRLGRSTTEEQDWEEVRAYKAANINHVRTSHYPASRYFLEACDELGMYVEQENAACFQGGWNGIPVCCAPEDFVGEFTEMIERDRNHASILMWSLGNESGFEDTEGFRREFDYVKAVDDSRPVIFSYPFTVKSLPRPYDIYSMHYMDVEAPMGLDDIPVIHDEYMHISCYNLEELRRDPNVRNYWGKSIQKAWDRIFETDGSLGGDLWGGIDDIFHLPENVKEKWQHHSKGRAAGYGAWGSVLDIHRRWKPEGYLTKKAYTPVRIDESRVMFLDGKALVPVENRFDHTNLNELTLAWGYRKDWPWEFGGQQEGGGAERTVLIDGMAQGSQGQGSAEQKGTGAERTVQGDGIAQGSQGQSSAERKGNRAEVGREEGKRSGVCRWEEMVDRSLIRENIPPHTSGVLQLECAAPVEGEGLLLQFFQSAELIDEYVIKKERVLPNAVIAGKTGCEKNGSTIIMQINDANVINRTDTEEGDGKTGRKADRKAGEKTDGKAAGEQVPSVGWTETEQELVVTAGQSKFFFDKDTAQMTMGQYRGKALLCGGPHLVLTGAVLGEWGKTGPGVQAAQNGSQVTVTLTGQYSNGYVVWYDITIDPEGCFVTSYQIKGGGTDKVIKELGIRYDLMPGADRIGWLRRGLYSCYPEDHIGRNSGIAYRRNARAQGSGYMTVPEWSWKEDMWDDFLYARDDAENGLATRDFKALRENIRYFDTFFSKSDIYVRVEDRDCRTAARVSVSVDGNGEERTALIAAKRWAYPDLGWGNLEERRFYAGCGTYGSVVMRFGDDC